MIRLETVEDFENVRKALSNPNSKPWQYCVKPWGFCRFCKSVTEFEAPFGKAEFFVIQCLGCQSHFEVEGTGGGVLTGVYLTGNEVPPEFQLKVQKLNSRFNQREYFRTVLENKINELKRKRRQAENEIRRFAKLRLEIFSKKVVDD